MPFAPSFYPLPNAIYPLNDVFTPFTRLPTPVPHHLVPSLPATTRFTVNKLRRLASRRCHCSCAVLLRRCALHNFLSRTFSTSSCSHLLYHIEVAGRIHSGIHCVSVESTSKALYHCLKTRNTSLLSPCLRRLANVDLRPVLLRLIRNRNPKPCPNAPPHPLEDVADSRLEAFRRSCLTRSKPLQ